MKIKVLQLSKTIHRKTILSNVTLELYGGNIYGLIGKNGSGKTMLLRILAGLVRPSEGMVSIDEEVLGSDIAFPKSIGMLIEYPSFVNNYSGIKNLKALARITGIADTATIEDYLLRVGLDPKEKKSFSKYSLGMKQKLGIVCAIMENPCLILLDEPFNALDQSSVHSVERLIIEQKEMGALVIVAGHAKESLQGITDEFIELSDGLVIS